MGRFYVDIDTVVNSSKNYDVKILSFTENINILQNLKAEMNNKPIINLESGIITYYHNGFKVLINQDIIKDEYYQRYIIAFMLGKFKLNYYNNEWVELEDIIIDNDKDIETEMYAISRLMPYYILRESLQYTQDIKTLSVYYGLPENIIESQLINILSYKRMIKNE